MSASLAVFVFVYVVIVHIYRLNIPFLAKFILKKLKWVSTGDEEKRKVLQDLLDQQSQISMKEEFAKYAKIERKLIKLREELKSIKNSQVATKFTISWGITLALNTIYSIFMIGLIWRYRYEPIIVMEKEWVWPIGRILAFPCGVPGAVGITAWLATCSALLARSQGTINYLFLGERTDSNA